MGFAMEFSTIFLNLSFFGKWYEIKEATITKFKLLFVLTWFLVRVPGTIGCI
eukprot:CAMPEP_0197052080 /NCGR_PEP_ID=MMETSP1384-20130603/26619_1 /TAXON_ID=29189 /ORGANISM="Ammonia sp." /LENGTH=51 /DNA_ID=CAMNT_0042484727 /DNA_START=1 /DNA_END=153 /DNA_ORIENTATION=-